MSDDIKKKIYKEISNMTPEELAREIETTEKTWAWNALGELFGGNKHHKVNTKNNTLKKDYIRELKKCVVKPEDMDRSEISDILWSGGVQKGDVPMPEKRKFVYVVPPSYFGVEECECGNSNIEWSEFQHHVWCEKCQKDFKIKNTMAFGPTLSEVSKLIGINYDILNLEDGRVYEFPEFTNDVTDKYIAMDQKNEHNKKHE